MSGNTSGIAAGGGGGGEERTKSHPITMSVYRTWLVMRPRFSNSGRMPLAILKRSSRAHWAPWAFSAAKPCRNNSQVKKKKPSKRYCRYRTDLVARERDDVGNHSGAKARHPARERVTL